MSVVVYGERKGGKNVCPGRREGHGVWGGRVVNLTEPFIQPLYPITPSTYITQL